MIPKMTVVGVSVSPCVVFWIFILNRYLSVVPHASFVSVDTDQQADAKDRESFDFRAIIMKKKEI
jgi:hypothetical protein